MLQQGVNGVNNDGITPPQPSPSGEGVLANSLQTQNEVNGLNSENQLSNLPQNSLPQNPLSQQPNTDVILGLIDLISQVSQGKVKNTSELEELINSMEQLLEEK